ncbi:MAG: hypothetical protein Q9163_006169 [Psora crenata]
MDVTSSIISIAHAAKKVYDVGHAAYRSKEEQAAFTDTITKLLVKTAQLQRLEEKALKNKDDPRFAGFCALLASSQQSKNDKHAEPIAAGTDLQRLEESMKKTVKKLESKHGLKRLFWIHEKDDFVRTITDIKQWTDIVDSVLRDDHHLMALGTDDHVRDTNARVKTLEDRQKDEAAKAAEYRKIEAEERKQAAAREVRKAAEKAMRLGETRRIEIVRWISPLRFRERQSAILNQAPRSITKPYLVQTEEFDIWLGGQPWILHCEGKPGAGKTVLCALVGKYLTERFEKEDRNVPILYIYLNHKERDSQSLSNLFASLLKQLIQLSASSFYSKEAQSLYQGPESEARPSWRRFYQAFCEEVKFYERVVLIVDALDEASPLDVAPQLLDALYKIPKESKVHLSIMITSQRIEEGPPPTLQIECNECKKRPLKIYYQCHICLDGGFYLCQECIDQNKCCKNDVHVLTRPREVLITIEATKDEIRDYIRAELQAEQQIGAPEEGDGYLSSLSTTPLGRLCIDKPWLQAEISDNIVAKADGMFAMAQLYLSSFKSLGLTEAEILEMVDDLPEGYARLYEQHMDRISEESLGRVGSNVGMSALLWVVCANRPLRFLELQDALAINFKKMGFFNPSARRDKATIVRATAGLITIDQNEHAAVRLNHGSAQRYFDSTRDRWFPNASTHITQVSLHYLSLKELASPGEGEWEDKEFEMRGIDYPFLEYAYQYWGDHASDAIPNPDAETAIMRFVSDENKVAATIQAMWYLKSEADVDWDVRKGANALHICAWFGLTYAVSKLLDRGMEVNSRDPTYGQTPLMYACRRGKAATVALLLERGAHVNAVSNRGASALFEAVSAGHGEVLRILLTQSKADINAPHFKRSHQTALMIAVQEGKPDIVRFLLDQDSLDINRRDANNETALSLAVVFGQTAIAMQILERRDKCVQLDSTNWKGSSALVLAASEGQKEVVNTLLNRGADPSIKDKEGGGTALLRAIDRGHIPVVESMLKYPRVDVHCVDENDRGLLHGAATKGCTHIVRLLLGKDLDVNAQDNKGKTPLHDASQFDAFDVAELLLDNGANALLEDKAGRTPRTVAWQYGHTSVMTLLEDRNPRRSTEQGSSGEFPGVENLPVWALANLGFAEEIQKAISTRPKELYYLNPDNDNTALHCAVSEVHLDIVSMLLDAGLSPEAKNAYHRTVIYLAAITGNVPILQLLLSNLNSDPDEPSPTINARDKWGTTPLLAADSYRHILPCLLLIEAGATIPASRAYTKQSLFFSAIENGRLEAVQRLVMMGADVQSKNILGLTGLQMAKEGGWTEVERWLRKSKSVKVEGLGLGVEEEEEEEEERITTATATSTTREVPGGSEASTRQSGGSILSPRPSLEERFKALGVSNQPFEERNATERQREKAKRVRVPQLA